MSFLSSPHVQSIPHIPGAGPVGINPAFLTAFILSKPGPGKTPVVLPYQNYAFVLSCSALIARFISGSSCHYTTPLFNSLWYSFNSSPIKCNLLFSIHYFTYHVRPQSFPRRVPILIRLVCSSVWEGASGCRHSYVFSPACIQMPNPIYLLSPHFLHVHFSFPLIPFFSSYFLKHILFIKL